MLLVKNRLGSLYMLMLFAMISFQSQSQNSRLANLNPEGERDILADRSDWKEKETERKEFSSTFLTPDGRTIIHYSKEPVNYYNPNGMLVPVNIVPVISSKGLTAAAQPNPVSILPNGAVEITNPNGSSLTYSSSVKINGQQIIARALQQDGKNALMKDVLPGIDKTFEFRFNSVKYNYVLAHPVLSASDLTIEEELLLPAGNEVQPDLNFGRQDKKGWIGALSVLSSGKEIGSIRGALCYDANNNYTMAAYQLAIENGIQKIKIIVPDSWLNDPSRIYPVTIDPLVTGPTSTWSAGLIASCIAPASDSDSILVTIPAQISVTGFFVSGSYYANPFTTATMSQGAMYFRTSCNSSTSFTVTGTAGATAGTAYLTAYDLRSPLLCCKPQSCTAQTFYLSMHISRTGPGTGCNTTYLYHDPLSGYPFSAYVEGRTVEGYGSLWNVTPNTICSDVCTLTGTIFIRYGVPPYTITHPWMTGSITAGVATGCSFGTTTKALSLTIPSCPWTCDTISVLSVPPPTVVDACGNIILGTPPKTITIKEVPEVIASPNPIIICSGESFNATLTPCIGTSTVNWSGNGTSGTGTSISQTLTNTSTTVSATTYSIMAINNGCNSDTITLTVNTDPLPVAGFSSTPQPVIINSLLSFTDNTSVYGGTANSWLWDFGDGTYAFTQNPVHSYAIPGTYSVCLAMQTSDGCSDTICQNITVIPAEIILPNVITPNGDNQNEILYFKYLEYFGSNNLKIFDRWGTSVYEKENYGNDWNPANVSDGTYYYVLTLQNGKTYPGYLQIIHN
ncbi:MAG TPA: gliding motility-associated C-terminal domain-containing protein [Bacteroidia bacterium]|jgi:gliding motility-associated-like protein